MRLNNDKPGKFVAVGLITMAVALVSAASCGSHDKSSGFGGPGGASSGASSGSGDDSSILCLVPPCGASSGVIGLDGSGGTSSGQIAHMDAGVSINDVPGTSGLSTATIAQLEAGGPVDSAMKWLYPYDLTIFPGGILPPVLQWSAQSGGTPDGVYLHMKSQLFEYKGVFGKTNPTQLPIPTKAWNSALSQSNGGADVLTVQLTTITGGKVSGPITERWQIAIGSLKGVIYYNTYTSQIAGNNGAVMQLKPGNATPTALLAIAGSASPVPTGPCISCHSVSADGSMLVAQKHFYPGGLAAPGSMSFNLKTTINAMNPTPLATTMNDDWGFSAVYPDGSRVLTAGEATSSSSVTALFPVANTNNPGMIGPAQNVMYNPTTGATIAYTGLAVKYAMMPMFSPNGKKIVYNDVDAAADAGLGAGHGGHALVVQDFNAATNTFSNPVVIYNDPNGYPGWPFFTPDSKYVVFAMGGSNFASIPPASFSGIGPVQAAASDVAASDLYITCLSKPGTALALNLANGFRNGNSYLPYPGRDEHLNFYPTGSPVAAGGYFWVFFTSRRQYGNLMVDASNNNAVPDPVFHAETKKIWASAVTIDAMEGSCATDPSHPAFLLPGQELVSGNIRAFAALAPCAAMGASCQSGVDCCGGYCINGKCGVPTMCSTIDNKCTMDSDCCAATPPLRCIAGFCQNVPPPM